MEPTRFEMLKDAISRHRLPGTFPAAMAGVDLAGCADEERSALLWYALQIQHVEAVRWLLQQGVNADAAYPGALAAPPGLDPAKNWFGLRPVHVVAGVELLELLLAAGADPRGAGPGGVTPLHSAARSAHADVVEALLRLGVEPDLEDAAGNTPLLAACAAIPRFAAATARYERCVRLLLERGVRVDVVGADGLTPLIAVRDDLRPLLLERGADVTRVTQAGLSALHNAASAATAAEMIRRGADVHARLAGPPHCAGFTPLHLAPNAETIAALLDGGADIDAVDQRGRTALHLRAEMRGEAELVKLLCRRGAKVDLQDQAGNSPLHRVADTSAKALLAARPDLRLRNAAGRPPLFEALRFWARLDNWEKLAAKAIAQFFEAGQDPAATDGGGENLLHAAARLARRPETMRLLLELGVDANGVSSTGATPLHVWAAEGVKAEIGATLLAAGADPARRDAQGRTPCDSVGSRPRTFRKVIQP